MAIYTKGRTLVEAIPSARGRVDNSVYVWMTSCAFPINPSCTLPEGFKLSQTLVISAPNMPVQVYLSYEVKGHTGTLEIGNFSSLDELRGEHPNLFEVNGNLSQL